MIIDFSVQYFLSFQEEQTLSLLSVNNDRDNILLPNIIKINNEYSILKSSVILGANASGKTNLLLAIKALKEIICNSIEEIKENFLSKLVPFSLEELSPICFDMKFILNDEVYKYSISIKNKKILEENLYIYLDKIECLLFKRKGQKIESWDNERFSELNGFINEDNELQKTRENVPLLSVLKSFEGQRSSSIFDFFNEKIIYLSGLNEIDENFAFSLLEEDDEFMKWVEDYLPVFDINSITIDKVDKADVEQFLSDLERHSENDNDIAKLLKSLILSRIRSGTNEIEAKKIKIFKLINDNNIPFPAYLESDGTRKALGMLAWIYKSIKENRILIIDEFDSKFHTLLTKYLFYIFHKQSEHSQIIATLQDSQLLDTNIFRRDQVWFMQKNRNGFSELFSLVEYKEEHMKHNYSNEYLSGIYGAIPYFQTKSDIKHIMD